MEFLLVSFPSMLSLIYIILTMTCFFPRVQPLCHKDEHTALLQFKQSFIVDKSTCFEPSNLPKTTSWKEEGAEDCCSWDGVECDEQSGHVIGVDLSSSCLYGSINSTSTLFHLSQLQMLNLAFNDFNYSRIPSALGHLSRLTHLNLSYSFFYGQIPSEILQLSNLVLLDLSRNADFSAEIELLKLDKPDLSSLVHNLTKLEHLHLSYVDINSEVPAFLGNLSSLTSLTLKYCGLYGKFPNAVFSLPNLQILKLDGNQRLSGFLHEFHSGCPLKVLSLSQMEFGGQIPPSLQNMTQLNRLDLGDNRQTGQLPSWFANFTRLAMLDISSNFLTGAVPPSFSRLRNLEFFSLALNELSGTVDIEMFLGMKYLTGLQLRNNKLTVLTRSTHNASIPKLEILLLDYCNLFIFPDFLRYQHSLLNLGLSGNHLSGQVPRWVWNISIDTNERIDISDNNLIGFDQSQLVIPGVSLRFLHLSFNMLKGTLPIPPPSIIKYDISNNELSGQVSPSFCNLSSIQALELSNNKLSGVLPQCLRKLTNSMFFLNMRNNSIHGIIPPVCDRGSKLTMIDLSQNQFEGPLPRFLANCTMLEFINLGDNRLNDVFPSWYGTLPELRVLVLRSNLLHGVIKKLGSNYEFPNLRIADLSDNSFTGILPSGYFKIWNSMKGIDATNSSYMMERSKFNSEQVHWNSKFIYSVTITNKGMIMDYEKIRDNFGLIDLSRNKFGGGIPECIGNLSGIHVLNLSHNNLSGFIPSSMGNIRELESLDLSQNKLSGEIPQQLAQLTFLSLLNVSHNFLKGPIPTGHQFDTFESNSYEGNLELCGDPLPNKCNNSETSSQPPNSNPEEDPDSRSLFELDWKFVVIGYCSGAVFGMIIGHFVIKKNPFWFFKTFGLRQHNRRRRRRWRT